MARDTRNKNENWTTFDGDSNRYHGEVAYLRALLAVAMDVRDELRALNQHLRCHNFVDMPRVLRQVRANTSRIPKQKNV